MGRFRQIPENENDDDFDKATELLNAHFEPQKHRLYDVYEFRQAKQGIAETLDQYYTRLRTLSKRCDFADPDFEIMLQIVLYGTVLLRKQALRDPKMTLHGLLAKGRQLERSNVQSRHIENTIYVTAQDGGCLLSIATPQELGLISLHLNQVDTQTKASRKEKGSGLSKIKDEKVRNILHKHSRAFQGVGKLNNRQIELLIDINVKPASLSASVKSPSI